MSQLLTLEDFRKIKPDRTSEAHKRAKHLGLDYYGFGRYGKNGKMTHFTDKGKLVRYRWNDDLIHKAEMAYDNETNLFNWNMKELKNKNPKKYKFYLDYYNAMKNQEAFIDKSKQEEDEFHNEDGNISSLDIKALKKDGQYDWKYLERNQQESLDNYTGNMYKRINKSLIANDINVAAIDDDIYKLPDPEKYVSTIITTIKDLDKITRGHALERNTRLYSGISNALAERLKVGKEFTIKAFRSSSVSAKQAAEFAKGHAEHAKYSHHDEYENDKTLKFIQFEMVKGQQGFYMAGKNNANTYQGENEFLLPRNLKIKVIDKIHSYLPINKDQGITDKTAATIYVVKALGIDSEDKFVENLDQTKYKKMTEHRNKLKDWFLNVPPIVIDSNFDYNKEETFKKYKEFLMSIPEELIEMENEYKVTPFKQNSMFEEGENLGHMLKSFLDYKKEQQEYAKLNNFADWLLYEEDIWNDFKKKFTKDQNNVETINNNNKPVDVPDWVKDLGNKKETDPATIMKNLKKLAKGKEKENV